MPKYCVTLEDARTIEVHAPDEKAAKAQAAHEEASRLVTAQTKNRPNPAGFSPAASVVKLKD